MFLDAPSHLYKRVCPSVCPSVRGSVCGSVRGSVSIKENRELGASYVGYQALFNVSGDQKNKLEITLTCLDLIL